VTGIDELAHEAETEAEVLRAVSHLSPRFAAEFLFRLALKVRRACQPALSLPVPVEAPPEEPETVPAPNALGRVHLPGYGRRGANGDGLPIRVLEFVRKQGKASVDEIKKAVGAETRDERTRVSGAIGQLAHRGLVRRDGTIIAATAGDRNSSSGPETAAMSGAEEARDG
jgi:hypothetical protein